MRNFRVTGATRPIFSDFHENISDFHEKSLLNRRIQLESLKEGVLLGMPNLSFPLYLTTYEHILSLLRYVTLVRYKKFNVR